MNRIQNTKERATPKSTYKKFAFQWLNEVQFFNQTLVQVESFVLRNRQLLKATNRYHETDRTFKHKKLPLKLIHK